MNQRNKLSLFGVALFSALTSLSACADLDSSSAVDDESAEPVSSETAALTSGNAPMVTTTLSQSAEDIVNPERGYYATLNLLSSTSAASLRSKGHSLGIAIVRLDAYRDSSIPSAFLSQLDAGFASARAAGVKVILRFTYNASLSAGDASKSRILGHISQLKPILQKNADVIALMQGGFIGAWGEWHSSTHGLDNNTDRKAIIDALLAALPSNRSVALRTPMFKANIYGSAATSSSEAYNGGARARLGHHNDCFLASSSDMGTYASPVSTWKSYTSADTKYVPMGGETCAVSTLTECSPALTDMTNNHFSYLNKEYLGTVVNGWTTKGCGAEIKNRLGYRFALKRVAVSSQVRPGGVLDLEFDIKNYGFATPFNDRPFYVVLRGANGFNQHVHMYGVDPRKFAPGTTTTTTAKFRLPSNLPAGTYRLSIWMPDAASTIHNDPRYAIRMANTGAWDAATGENILTSTLKVSTSAPGAYVTNASTFTLAQ